MDDDDSSSSSPLSELYIHRSQYTDVSVSPQNKRVAGKTLKDYRNIIIDNCQLMVTLIWTGRGQPPDSFRETFRQLLKAEGIDNKPYGNASLLEKHTFRIRNAEHMRRLICKLSTGYRYTQPIV